MPTPAALTTEILERCRTLGFAAAGVCPVEPSRYGAELRDWLSQGRQGSMSFMDEFIDQRLNPATILDNSRWMIMVADLYTARDHAADPPLGPRHARIARYARGRNYHEVIKRRLHKLSDELRERYPGSEFRSFTDTAPVMEREHAARAGLGWLAKNTMLIHPRLGSYFVIGGVMTTMDLETPREQPTFPDHCGTCTRCIDACPTGAITPYKVDGARCISYLTIERREEIDPSFFKPIGNWLYGCDVCQEVCPHNSPRSDGAAVGEAHASYAPRHASFDVLDVLNWDEEARRAAFTSSAMKRATLAMMKRNALIVAGNLLNSRPDPALESRVRQATADQNEPELVRRTAREVLRNLGRL